jgi:hypothetical protein
VIDQAELDEEARLDTSKFLLSPEDTDHSVDPETQARLEALLEAAGNIALCIVPTPVISPLFMAVKGKRKKLCHTLMQDIAVEL